MNRVAKGREIEQKVKAHLLRQGMIFVAENVYYRCGEIDLVFRDKMTWVFVEVKYRASSRFGSAEDALNQQKRRRLTKAIAIFMAQYNINPHHHDHRIDLVAVNGTKARWYKAI